MFLLNTNRYLGSHHFQERKGSAQSHERDKMSRDSFSTINKAQFRKSAYADQSLQHSALRTESLLHISQAHNTQKLIFNPPTPPCLTQFTCRLSPGCVICVQTQSRSFPLPSLLSLTFTPEDFSEGSLCLTEQAELSERLLFSSPDKVTISWVKIHLQGRSAFSYK